GLYEKALPSVKDALEKHLQITNPLADHPTVRVCRIALLEINEAIEFGQKAIRELVTEEARIKMRRWVKLLDDALLIVGGVADGVDTLGLAIDRIYSAKPYQFDGFPKRDERFPDPYN